MDAIRQWERFEFSRTVDVPAGNPFTGVRFAATVRATAVTGGMDATGGPGPERDVEGFYDGEGVFKLRVLGEAQGEYAFETRSNLPALHGLTGTFTVTAPAEGVHGPVRAAGTRFRYADGTPAFIMGTTAYAWHYRPAEVRAQTLESFTAHGFNKVRMLVFPKHYTGGFNQVDVSYEPPCYPFEGEPKAFDFTRPNPAYFRAFEERVEDLMRIGVEADVILFHPYDSGHWDIDAGMDEDDALLYLRYIVARLAAYRNVWWSLANEYDIDPIHHRIGPDRRDWDVIGAFVQARDPYGHLISAHNIPFGIIYPDRHWLTHVSYQHPDTYTLLLELVARYQKPVINDEYQYEGNLRDDWGNSSPELVLERHWKSLMAGGYASHGEAFVRDGNRKDIFWSYGGTMTGESAPRLRYLREIAESLPLDGMERQPLNSDSGNVFALAQGHELVVIFCRHDLPGKWPWLGPWDGSLRGARYHATVHDLWNCRVVDEFDVDRERRPEFRAWTLLVLRMVR